MADKKIDKILEESRDCMPVLLIGREELIRRTIQEIAISHTIITTLIKNDFHAQADDKNYDAEIKKMFQSHRDSLDARIEQKLNKKQKRRQKPWRHYQQKKQKGKRQKK